MSKAVAVYIKSENPGIVTLLAMGERAQKRVAEDEACADYLEYILTAGRTIW